MLPDVYLNEAHLHPQTIQLEPLRIVGYKVKNFPLVGLLINLVVKFPVNIENFIKIENIDVDEIGIELGIDLSVINNPCTQAMPHTYFFRFCYVITNSLYRENFLYFDYQMMPSDTKIGF